MLYLKRILGLTSVRTKLSCLSLLSLRSENKVLYKQFDAGYIFTGLGLRSHKGKFN